MALLLVFLDAGAAYPPLPIDDQLPRDGLFIADVEAAVAGRAGAVAVKADRIAEARPLKRAAAGVGRRVVELLALLGAEQPGLGPVRAAVDAVQAGTQTQRSFVLDSPAARMVQQGVQLFHGCLVSRGLQQFGQGGSGEGGKYRDYGKCDDQLHEGKACRS